MTLARRIQRARCWLADELGVDRWHEWKRAYRHVAGAFRAQRRQCRQCLVIQERLSPTGGWVTVFHAKPKRTRRKAVKVQTVADEQHSDEVRGLSA